ncbi:hypothetical protein MPLA_1650009 [Mesorhizobium sp. ORS 3359]|nr:hypothetical protein MPLA_1650009 [Mesorhizobium sp. ORS 3359]
MLSRVNELLPSSANESFIWVAYAKVNRQSFGPNRKGINCLGKLIGRNGSRNPASLMQAS